MTSYDAHNPGTDSQPPPPPSPAAAPPVPYPPASDPFSPVPAPPPPVPHQTRQAESPFSGIPRGDLILDVLAAVALVLSLTLVWGPDGMGLPRIAAAKVDVLLVTLISLLSLTLPYLASVGALPATWTVITRRNVRVLANMPYALLVLVYYVISLTNSSQYLRAAVPIGLAGAALAAQPRIAELGPLHLDTRVSELWMRAFGALAGLVVVTTLIGFLLSLGESFAYFSVAYLLQSLALAALVVAPLTVAALGVWRRSGEWAVALGVLGAALGLANLLGGGGYYSASWVFIGVVFIPAAGAIAVSPVVRRIMPETNGPELWLGAAVRVLELVILIAGIHAFLQLISLFSWMAGVTVLRLIVNVLVVVGAVVARSALKTNPVAARPLVLGVSGGMVLGGLVVWAVVSRSDSESLDVVETALFFLLPAAVVALLTAPASVRAFFPARVPSTPAPGWASAPAGVAGMPGRAPEPGGQWGQQQSTPTAAPWPAQPTSTSPGGVTVPRSTSPSALAEGVAVAPPSKRLAAFVLDGVTGSVFVLVAYMFSIAVFSGAVSAGSDSAMTAGFLGLIFIPGLVSLAFGIAQLVWEGKQGLTVGNKLMGIQTVTVGSDDPPGIGHAFIRRLIEGLGSLVIVGGPVIAASAAWDEPTRRQGWQDKIAGTEMVLRQGATGMAGNTAVATQRAAAWPTTTGPSDSHPRFQTPPVPAATWPQQPALTPPVPAPPVPAPPAPPLPPVPAPPPPTAD